VDVNLPKHFNLWGSSARILETARVHRQMSRLYFRWWKEDLRCGCPPR